MSASAGSPYAKPLAKILIIVENLPVPFDTRVWQEANALTEAGYQVTIICPTGKGFEMRHEVLNNITIYRHPMPAEGNGPLGYVVEYSWALAFELYLSLKILFTEGFDVLQACNPPDNIFLIGGLFKLFGKKFVFDHHDINPELYIAKFGKKGFLYDALCWFEKMSFAVADMSVATNESYREIALTRGNMDPSRVHIVRSGPKLERMKMQPPKAELKKGKRFMVGYVGVIGQQEGLDYLLDAAINLRDVKKRDDIRFDIIGGGPHLEALRQRTTTLGLDDIVTFHGRVPDQHLLDILNTADVCINTDEYNEMNDKSTMNKIMEYMALAKPIVQFNLKEGRYSAREASLYAENNNAMSLADNILTLLDDEGMRRRMGDYGRARVENDLNWNISKQNLIKAYDGLFGVLRAPSQTEARQLAPTPETV